MKWVVAGLLVVAMAADGQGPPQRPGDRIQGMYEVQTVGYYRGSGMAVVAGADGSRVNITLPRVEGENGEVGTLAATNLAMENGRFRGTGTLRGRSIAIWGRVDLPDGEIVKVARFSASYSERISETVVRRGRIIGHRTGGAQGPTP